MGIKNTETALVRCCLDYLRLRGVPAWRSNCGGAFFGEGKAARFVRFGGLKGISDIIGIIPPHGRFLAVEAKLPGRKPTPEQEAFLGGVLAAGGVSGVCRSVADLEALLGG